MKGLRAFQSCRLQGKTVRQHSRPHNQPLLWTGPRRVGMLFYSLAQYRASRCRPQSVVRYPAMATAYDKAKWHSDGNFPKDVPSENGGTHIGFFLAWAIAHDLVSDELRDDGGDDLAATKERRMSGRTFLFKHLDGVLSESDLNDQGNAFAKHYYSKYMGQYDRLVRSRLPTAYHAKDIWGNYDAVAKLIDKQFNAWQASQPPSRAG